MYETEQQKKQREQKEKEMKEKKEKQLNEMILKEDEILKIKTEEMKKNKSIEIHQIEEWSSLELDEIIFDSECCSCERDITTIGNHIMNRSNVAFLITSEDDVVYGGVIYSTIDSTSITDENAFVFSFKENIPMKYHLLPEKQTSTAFTMYEDWENGLFSFGNEDIWIGKKDIKSRCNQYKDASFKYDKNIEALTGFTGTNEEDLFEIKHIQIIQMKRFKTFEEQRNEFEQVIDQLQSQLREKDERISQLMKEIELLKK